MKLWLLEPVKGLTRDDAKGSPWVPWYDKTFGFVIRAETEERARQIAADNSGAELRVWTNPSLATCVELTADGPERMILQDFAAA